MNDFDPTLDEIVSAYVDGEATAAERARVEADPALDYSQVTRPRSLPLLTSVETSGGLRHVWTTFSDDQIDLNYAEPAVLARMLRILDGPTAKEPIKPWALRSLLSLR